MSDNIIIPDDDNEMLQQAQNEVRARFNAANDKCGDIIEAYITGGYMQDLAKMLIYVGTDRAKAILSKMSEPDKERLESAYKSLSDKKVTAPEVISSVGKVLKEAGFYGKVAANAVTEGLNYEQERAVSGMLPQLFEINPLLTMNIEAQIYSFDMILDMSDRDIQKLLREIDSIELAKALKNVERDVQDKIFRNMSRRAAAMLKEDMEYMGPIRKSDIFDAQHHIIGIIRRLETNGDIVLAGEVTEYV